MRREDGQREVMSCRDCTHYDICIFHLTADEYKQCFHFKNQADVVEVRRGKWILEREPDGTPYCFHCSVCDDCYRIGFVTRYNYCPNCGSKMEK